MTVDELLPAVTAAVSRSSRRTYQSGFRRLAADLGDQDLTRVRLADLQRLRDEIQRAAGERTVARAVRTGRALRSYDPDAYGKGAAGNFVSSAKFFFAYATAAGLVPQSPAAALTAPRRPPAPERPLEETELHDLWAVATTTGKDPVLDGHLLRFIRHTAARREGCLNLTLGQLNLGRRSVTLSEKYGHGRELPLALPVLQDLAALAAERGATAGADQVFRYRDGTPMTRRRFNSLFDRIDRHLGWTEPLDVGAHWLRHTTLADIAAVSDIRVAAAYAGHAPEALGVIGRYTRVTFTDLVDAYEAVFGPRG